ncbi:MAG: hypothetical protein MJA82_10885 [Clostridia bacterium]|nr:hypothetical protein [Clostridia bacterium]
MSSTNRSEARKTHKSDYYVTPVREIENFLNELQKEENQILIKNFLDPCAGGLIGKDKMSYPEAIKNAVYDRYGGKPRVETIDIRLDSLANIKGNYLKMDCKDKYDVIITNPPFNISLDIIKKALNDVKDNGYVIMLLRLNYFGSKSRKKFWEEYGLPKYTFVHHKRMSFTDDGKTDSIEYAHFVWEKGYRSNFTNLRVI